MSESETSEPQIVDVPTTLTAVIAGVVPMDQIANFFDRSFTALAATIGEQGASITGPAFALYHSPPDATADLEVGFPTDRELRPQGDVRAGSLPGGRVARFVHHGGYDGLGATWQRLGEWIAAQGLTPAAVLWEVYVTEPSPEMDPADLRTELYWRVG
jgi:effector-binding domain-containing protein